MCKDLFELTLLSNLEGLEAKGEMARLDCNMGCRLAGGPSNSMGYVNGDKGAGVSGVGDGWVWGVGLE